MPTPRITPAGPTLCVLARVRPKKAKGLALVGEPVLLTWTAAPSPDLCFTRYGESEGSQGERAEQTGRDLAYRRRLALVTVTLDALLSVANKHQGGSIVEVTLAKTQMRQAA